jgi:hypothetical protein
VLETIFAARPEGTDGPSPSEFASVLEKELFDLLNEPDENGRRSARTKYVARFRSLHFTLKSKSYEYFQSRIAKGELDPATILRTEGDDLLSPEQRRKNESVREKSMKGSVKVHMAAPIAKRTHKGEEVIDSFGVDNRLEENERERKREDQERAARQRERSLSFSVQGQGSPVSIEAHTSTSPPAPALSPTSEAGRADAPLSPVEPRSSGVDLQPEDLGLDEDAAAAAAKVSQKTDKAGKAAVKEERVPEQSNRPTSFNLDSIWGSFKAAPAPPEGAASAEDAVEAEEDKHDSDAMDEGTPEPHEAGADEDKAKLPDDYDPFAFENEERGETEEDLDVLLHGRKTNEGESTTPRSSPPADKKPSILDLPTVWSGDLTMPEEGGFPAVAVQVAGRELGVSEQIWRSILPERLNVDGRVPTKVATDYLVQNTFAATREMAVVALLPDLSGPSLIYKEKPEADRVLARQKHLIDYFVRKDRHGVVSPPEPLRRIVKDIYIVPLRASDPVPEFVELLDHKLGDAGERDRDIFIAVLVLQKNLIPAPPSTQPPPPMTASQPSTSYSSMPPPAGANNFMPSYPPPFPPAPQQPPAAQPVLDPNLQSLLNNPALLAMVKDTQAAGAVGGASVNPGTFPALNNDQGLLNNLVNNPNLLNSLLANQSQSPPQQPAPAWGQQPPLPPPGPPQWQPQQDHGGSHFHPSRTMNDPDRPHRYEERRGRGGWRGGGGRGRGRGGDRNEGWRGRARGYR